MARSGLLPGFADIGRILLHPPGNVAGPSERSICEDQRLRRGEFQHLTIGKNKAHEFADLRNAVMTNELGQQPACYIVTRQDVVSFFHFGDPPLRAVGHAHRGFRNEAPASAIAVSAIVVFFIFLVLFIFLILFVVVFIVFVVWGWW